MCDKENISKDCAVKVAVRERPFSKEERQQSASNCIEHENENIIIVEDRPFVFNHVFDQNAQQEDVYETLVQPLVTKFLNGFKCSLLAYGQSGNGKTYTMGLGATGLEADKDAGIIVRTLRDINARIRGPGTNSDGGDATEDDSILLAVSFIEIYNEKIYDLLAVNHSEPIHIRGAFLNHITRREMRNEQDACSILSEAYHKRHVRATKINATSSRSHAVFTIHATIKGAADNRCVITSELNLVDLAGAEGVRRTGHHGPALTEGVNINQGLLSVGRILQSIVKGEKNIPYRESVLTRVLQESLNRNCYLTLLACISPVKADTKETLSTLRFAENVGTLRNDPKINVIVNEITMARRKTPVKQAFTPRQMKSNGKGMLPPPRKTPYSLSRKNLSYHLPPNASTIRARKIGQRQPSVLISRGTVNANSTAIDFAMPAEVTSHQPNDDLLSFGMANVSSSTLVGQPTHRQFASTGTHHEGTVNAMDFMQYMEMLESKLDRIQNEFVNVTQMLMNSTAVGRKRTSSPGHNHVCPPKVANMGVNRSSGSMDDILDERNLTFELENTFKGHNSTEIRLPAATKVRREVESVRRSSRIKTLNESRLLAAVKEEKAEQKPILKKNRYLKNPYLTQYFEEDIPLSVSSAKNHTGEVLNLLNKGNLKELCLLPGVGPKTAFQVMLTRSKLGHFKTFKDLKKMNWTERKIDKFLTDNLIEEKC